MKFSALLFSIIIAIAIILSLIGFSIHILIGISLGISWTILSFAFLLLIRYLLQHKDYAWTANAAQFIKKRVEIIRFLLQVLFMNPYGHHRLKTKDMTDFRKMKFVSSFSSKN